MPDLSSYIRNCGSCNAAIIWARTIKGKSMPVDAEITSDGNVLLEIRQGLVRATVLTKTEHFDQSVRTLLRKSHFTTCPDAAEWRKGRG